MKFPLDPQIDHDFNARESVASFDDEYGKLITLSDHAMATLPRRADLVFDPESGAALDLYGVEKGRPVFLWIHGGYWRIGDKKGNAFAAPGLVANGVAVAVMDYSLAPAASLEQIVHEVRSAVAWLHREGPAMGLNTPKIHVGGSSAGGHLTGAVIAEGWHADYSLPDTVIGAALALSGIYDLEPLLSTQVNAWMDMDMGTVAALSPIRHIPEQSQTQLILSVGGQERAGFLRETESFNAAWTAKGHSVVQVEMADYNHFDITGTLADPQAELVQATLKAIKACP
ncbi:alpha/beta hydrolase [Sulfitobacter sp. M57]|uniref:alpha/beta hydrolase n=1 Tax=unclassified Sulfitobacter TaxID=196795 RepID=UPI0023E0FA76|nr:MULTISPECIES: alpha/beta hydrolase [unclassified Sulfitobacter]MDF3416577.1 alpha/beta hydrolase [Sulfitobacter sp. KE5]MDF3424057.1 alpha/beta hydrolase [Sulfitobacter sp. KE43]MDF3435122.1 alpha/beta hydrolase [Sulfitobacter sp. KE42]MDF3460762.1 alpha/beta hydrolase [Sulfitobacter sp. S74]MDF3464659.1 alpha/beta hydrolase [Sulfitobacter sp. Ks18]